MALLGYNGGLRGKPLSQTNELSYSLNVHPTLPTQRDQW